jgi:DNA polymerase-3 subunit alpha
VSGRRGGADDHAPRAQRRRRARRASSRASSARGNFFLELQPNGLEEQETVNGHLIELSKKTGIGVIATNDCHYLNQDDARSHEILMCVQQKKTIHDEKRMHHRNDAFFVKTPAEMEAYFKHIPEALENAAKLGELCNVEFKLGDTFLPKFQVPDGMTAESYLTRSRARAARRIDEAYKRGEKIDGDAYEARLVLELGVIQKMHFAGYFLIVWDFIRFAKEHGIPVGPGRGSGAGRWSRTRRASPTSIRSRTSCCSSAS